MLTKKVKNLEKDKTAVIFGSILRRLRRDRDLSQEALAIDAGLSTNHISQMERGSRSPTLKTMLALCQALKVSFIEIATRIEEKL